MMKRKNNLIFVCIGMLAVLCGCTPQNGQVIPIGSGDSTEEVGEELGSTGAEDTGEVNAAENATGILGTDVEGANQDTVSGSILVYVCGAVNAPGVVEIHRDSRVEDALEAAGGFAPEASTTSVNLAAWVTDGQMIYFPTREEARATMEQEAAQAAGLVNINLAGVEELCTLPGIGETRALDIIAYREEHGGFASCEEIMQVTGIKTNIFEKLCDKITVK